MYTEPTQSAIQTVQDILNVSRDEARRKLRAHSNDVERVINAHYESATHTESQPEVNNHWDEGQFHTDRTGSDYQNQDVPSFSIHSEGSLGPNIFAPAPSRPPSRVDQRETIDLTAEHAAADASKSLTPEEREAEEMKQAMELSLSGTLPQARSVTGGVEFGPATKEYYDNQNWAMTVSGSAHEIILNPEPADRKRERDQPAFLKPSVSGQYLAPLLTILHSVPLANEMLLFRDHVLSEYGQDNEWWDGTAIKLPQIIDLADRGWNPEADEIIYETQRLMAFMSMTERAYGSVEVLAHLKAVEDHNQGKVVGAYLEAWQKAVSRKWSESPNISLFHSVGTRAPFDGTEPSRHEFSCLDVYIDEHIAEQDYTLYDALDDIIWAENMGEQDSAEIFLESIGEVFTMRLTRQHQSKSSIDVRIPAVWYPDRYLESCKGVASEMRSQKSEINKLIDKAEQLQTRLTKYQPSCEGKGKSIDGSKLLQTAIEYFEQSSDIEPHTIAPDMDGDLRMGHSDSGLSHADLARELRNVSKRVERKLEVLDRQKESLRADLRKLSAMLTAPSSEPEEPPHHLYTLRGVSTEPNITYVLCPLETNAADNTSDAAVEENQILDQARANVGVVLKQKVPEAQVLKAAQDECRTVLLVYASEKAVRLGSKELPPQLQNFVRADNLAFSLELEAARPASAERKTIDDSSDEPWGAWGGDPDHPIEPLTRRSDPTLPPYLPPGPPINSKYFSGSMVGDKDRDGSLENSDRNRSELSGGGQEMKELGVRGFATNVLRPTEHDEAVTMQSPSSLGAQDEIMEDAEVDQVFGPKNTGYDHDKAMK